MPSAGDSVAQNAEAVKRDECLPENMDVEEDIPSNMDVMERQDGEFVHTFYMKKRKESAPQTFNAGVDSKNAADANSSDTSIRTSGRESQGKYSPDSENDRRKAAQFAVIQSGNAAEDAAEKMQYMAEDPATLLPELTGRIQFDLTWLSEHYDALPRDNQAYVIRDADGAFVSEFFWARYGAKDGKGWIALEAVYDGTHNWGASYIVDETYEEAYYYTTQNGYEFLITADSGTVWADCTTDHASVSLYGAYLTTQDMEQIVEYMAVSMRE